MREAPRFLLDEHISDAVAAGLRQAGAVVHAIEKLGRAGLPGAEQLEFARINGLVVVTHDVDFLELHGQGTPHAGIAWCPARKYHDRALIDVLALLHSVVTAAEMVGHIEYL